MHFEALVRSIQHVTEKDDINIDAIYVLHK